MEKSSLLCLITIPGRRSFACIRIPQVGFRMGRRNGEETHAVQSHTSPQFHFSESPEASSTAVMLAFCRYTEAVVVASVFTKENACSTSSRITRVKLQRGKTAPRPTKTRRASAAHSGAWPSRMQSQSRDPAALTCSSVKRVVALTTATFRPVIFVPPYSTRPPSAPPPHPLCAIAVQFNYHLCA